MPVKRLASMWASRDSFADDDSASRGDDQFVISPRLRRETRKSTHRGEASSSQADEEAAWITVGHAAAAA
jgi:hypothetical protein